MMKLARINYSQEYIPHGYIELRIPPNQHNQVSLVDRLIAVLLVIRYVCWLVRSFVSLFVSDARK